MKFWPNFSDKSCAASRAIVSVLPPAPNGTTIVTGRVGQPSARAGAAANAAAKIVAKAARYSKRQSSRRIIVLISGPAELHPPRFRADCHNLPCKIDAAGAL